MHVFDLVFNGVTAFFAWRAARAALKAKGAAESNGSVAAEIHASVGEANGETIKEIVDELKRQGVYQQTRNHDIIGGQQRMELALEMLPTKIAAALRGDK